MLDAIVDFWDAHTRIDKSRVKNLLAFAWGFGTVERPNFLNFLLDIGRSRTLYRDGSFTHSTIDWLTTALYWNGIVFVRLTSPFGFFWQLRWGGAKADPALWQFGIGYDNHGRFRFIFRIQSDASARAGTTIPNDWEVAGWAFGEH